MKVSIVMPVYNSATTLDDTLKSLLEHHRLFSQLILVNDGSTDKSPQIIQKYLHHPRFKNKISLINHPESLGLSASYNAGIAASIHPLIVTIHSDVILHPHALKYLLSPFKYTSVQAAYHSATLPRHLWLTYNFWQKCLFSRFVGSTTTGLDGKFDAYRQTALKSLGCFDSTTFHRAGEDSDMVIKLKKIGKVVSSKALITHLHNRDPKFSLKDYLYKHAQYAEAQGALLRRYGITSPTLFLKVYFREILFLSLLVPKLNLISLFLVIIYIFIYSKNVFLISSPTTNTFILPFVNLYLLPLSLFFSARGYFSGKQVL